MLERMLGTALAVLVILTAACSSLETREYAPGQIPILDSDHRIVAVTRTSGERVAFDRGRDGHRTPLARLEEDAVVGPLDGQAVRVDLADVTSVSVEERENHVGRTLLLIGVIGFATAVIVAASTVTYF